VDGNEVREVRLKGREPASGILRRFAGEGHFPEIDTDCNKLACKV
jgi:hypothetical protein